MSKLTLHINYVLICLGLLISNVVAAQVETLEKTIVERIELEIKLDTADRIYENSIAPEPKKITVEKQNYSSKNYALRLDPLSPKIKIFTIQPTPIPDPKGNFVRAGLGNYATSALETYLTNYKNDKYAYGIHLNHYASNRGPIDKINSGNSDNTITLFGEYRLKNLIIRPQIDFERARVNYYGYDPVFEPVERDSIKQVYSTFHAGLTFTQPEKNEKIGYNAAIDFWNTSNMYNTTESDFGIFLQPRYSIKEDYTDIYTDIQFYQSKWSNDTSARSRSFLMIKPYFSLKREKIITDIGFNVTYDNDALLEGQKSIHIYPHVNVEFLLERPHGLRAYVGLTGEMERNTYRSIVRNNPFVGNNVFAENTNKEMDLYAGLKGTLLKNFTFNVRGAMTNYRYINVYRNDPTDQSIFYIQQLTESKPIVNLYAEALYSLTKNFSFGLRTNYFNRDKTDMFHIPLLTNTISAGYILNEKFYLNVDFNHLNGILADKVVGETQEIMSLPDILDLSVKIDYRINKKISAFVEVNNLFSQKYERFQYYLARRINVLTGITYSF